MLTLNGSPIPIEDILAHAKKGLFFTGICTGFSPLPCHFYDLLITLFTVHCSLFTVHSLLFTIFSSFNKAIAHSPRFSYLLTYSKGTAAKHIFGGVKLDE